MKDFPKEEVQENSNQWKHVLYKIQIASGSSSVRLINLHRFPITSGSSKFRKDQSINALIQLTDMNNQFKNKVINKTIPLKDLVLICGHINNIQKYRLQPSKIFHYFISQLTLGKVSELIKPVQDSNSYFIQPDDKQDAFHFNYQINDHDQYQLKYQVAFVIDDPKQYNHRVMMCSVCGNRVANTYCRTQKKHFCDDCCNRSHQPIVQRTQSNKNSKIPQTPKHNFQSTNRTNSVSLCQYHGIRPDYFCQQCQIYICDGCAMMPKHNNNPQHPLKIIEFVYRENTESFSQLHKYPRQRILNLLQTSKKNIQIIKQNYQNIKQKIINELQKSLKQLEHFYHQKILPLVSDNLKLKMLLQKIDWTSAFVKVQQQQLRPQIYFRLYSRYEQQIKSLKIQNYIFGKSIEADLDVLIDIKIKNKQKIQLIQKQQIKSQKSNVLLNQKYNTKNINQFKFNPNTSNNENGNLIKKIQSCGLQFFKRIFSQFSEKKQCRMISQIEKHILKIIILI